MKNFRSTILRSFLSLIAIVFAGVSARAASHLKPAGYTPSGALVYERSLNPAIGITTDGVATGSAFSITDENGKTVMTGVLRPGKTFYISTGKLGTGIYRFRMGGQVLQQFIIK